MTKIFHLAAVLLTTTTAADDYAHTTFQTAAPFSPRLHIAADEAIVYGVNQSFPSRLDSWRKAGYDTAFMTGISWGGYDAYYGADPRRVDFKGERRCDERRRGERHCQRAHGTIECGDAAAG